MMKRNKEEEQYQSDDRSGEDVSDSDKEFNEIVEIDDMIKSISENTYAEKELHEKLIQLFQRMYDLKELIEFDSEVIQDIINNMLAQEIIFFSSYSQILKIAELGYRMQLSSNKFWQGIAHCLLLYYHEMDLAQIIPLCYYLGKAGYQDISLNPDSLPEMLKAKTAKLSKTATFQLMSLHIKDLLDLFNFELNDQVDLMLKLKLCYLIKVSKFKGFQQVMNEDAYKKMVSNLVQNLQEEQEGLHYLISEFNYDQCIDFLRICPDEKLTSDTFELIIALFNENSKKKKFYDGKLPTYSDVNLILNKMKKLKLTNDSESIQQQVEIVRFVLQQAITNTQEKPRQQKEISKEEEDTIEIMERDSYQDLEFIQILKNHQDLNIIDSKTALLILFEIQTQLQNEKPFDSKDECAAKLSIISHVLRSYEFTDKNCQKFLTNFDEILHKLIYESEAFDEYSDIAEYIKLRDISIMLMEIIGKNHRLSQQVDYLERKIFNYSQLYTI